MTVEHTQIVLNFNTMTSRFISGGIYNSQYRSFEESTAVWIVKYMMNGWYSLHLWAMCIKWMLWKVCLLLGS